MTSLKEAILTFLINKSRTDSMSTPLEHYFNRHDPEHILDGVLSDYKDFLAGEKSSYEESISKTEISLNELMGKVSKLQEYDKDKIRKLLFEEVAINKDIMDKLISERERYTNDMKKALDASKEASLKGIIKEASELLKEIIPVYLKTNLDILARFRSQYSTLINPDDMTDNELRKRFEAKLQIMKKDMSEKETAISEYKSKIKEISEKIAEIDTVISKKI